MTSSDQQPSPNKPADAPTTEPVQPATASPEEPARSKQPTSTREAGLRLLERAARYGVTSKETVVKIVRLAASSDHTLRRAAIPALTQIPGPEGYRPLIALLADPNATIQGEAAEALGPLGADEAIEPLKTLLTHDDPATALRSAVSLGRLKDQSGLAVVRRFLSGDNPHARLAAHALGVIVGLRFRPNAEGIAAARQHLKRMKKQRK